MPLDYVREKYNLLQPITVEADIFFSLSLTRFETAKMRWLWRVLPPIHAGSECGKRGGEHRQGFRRRTPGVGVRCGYQMTPQAWQSDLPKPQGYKGLTLQQRLTGLCSDNQCSFSGVRITLRPLEEASHMLYDNMSPSLMGFYLFSSKAV